METFAWYALGLAMRQLVFPLVGDCQMNYWPNTPAEEEKTENESNQRSDKLPDFLRGDKFLPTIITCCVASLPRWVLLRTIEALPKDDDHKELKGIGAELEGCLRTSKLIVSDDHLLARRLISFSKNPSAIRLSIWNALLRSLMYLDYRSVHFSSPLWKIIIGKEDPKNNTRRSVSSKKLLR